MSSVEFFRIFSKKRNVSLVKNPLQKENNISTNLYGKIKKRRQFHFLLYTKRRRGAFCVDGFIFLLYMICRRISNYNNLFE